MTRGAMKHGVRKRPWRGLRRTPPDARYDAVIVGAGIGGLFCANLLAREGLKVLLVEQHYMVGGYCSTFRRAGYTFDAASHFYPLLGNDDTITGALLRELGVEVDWVKMDPVDTFHFPDGSRFDVPADFDEYRRRLDAEFPHERENLDRFFDEVRATYLAGLLEYFRGRKTARLDPYRDLTLGEVLHRHFEDRKLKLLLTADCPHWGSPPSRISFVFDSMLRLSYFLGNYYPVGGSQAFADALAQRFEQQGGHILIHTMVEQISVEEQGGDPRVSGVKLASSRGQELERTSIEADVVISNADYRLTLGRLLDCRWVPSRDIERAEQLRLTYPCFLTHIGLRDVEPEVLEQVQGYYWNDWDFDRVGRDGLRCKIFAPTLYEPHMAPPDGQIVILQKVLEMDYDEVQDWPAHKRAVQEYVVDHLASVVPGVRDKIVTISSASAATSRRFTLNQEGAMLGWEMSPQQLGEHRPDIEGPVAGLWFVGHWTRPGGGITPVVVSAMRAVEAILGSKL